MIEFPLNGFVTQNLQEFTCEGLIYVCNVTSEGEYGHKSFLMSRFLFTTSLSPTDFYQI